MSVYLTIDAAEPTFIASTNGWGDFVKWADTLDDADALRHLCDHGWYEPLSEVWEQLQYAIESDPLDETTLPVAKELLALLDSGELALVTDGFVADGEHGLQESREPPLATPVLEAKGAKFSSTQINIADVGYSRSQGAIEPKLRALAAKIDDADLAEDGKEDTFHVTVKYGLHTNDTEEVRRVVETFGQVAFTLGKTSLFQNEDADVVKIDVYSPWLHRLNSLIGESLECTDTHANYVPHLTLAYVKPGLGAKYTDMTDVAGLEGTAAEIVFLDQDKKTTAIDIAWHPKKAIVEGREPTPVADAYHHGIDAIQRTTEVAVRRMLAMPNPEAQTVLFTQAELALIAAALGQGNAISAAVGAQETEREIRERTVEALLSEAELMREFQ